MAMVLRTFRAADSQVRNDSQLTMENAQVKGMITIAEGEGFEPPRTGWFRPNGFKGLSDTALTCMFAVPTFPFAAILPRPLGLGRRQRARTGQGGRGGPGPGRGRGLCAGRR